MNVSEISLKIIDLHYTYPNGKAAVQGVSLQVAPGTVFGLIGPNGAGKSTLLKLAAGLLRPARGQVLCELEDCTGQAQRAARWIGLMPDPLGVYTDITAREYLEFFARLLNLGRHADPRIDAVVEVLGLGPWLDSEVESLSAGWQRRLALGRILLSNCPVLLLDEPAAGLDITARSELLAIIRKLAQEGRTVVVSSHILPELQELADRFGILKDGRWVDVGLDTPVFDATRIARGTDSQHAWEIATPEVAAASAVLRELDCQVNEHSEDGLVIAAQDPEIGRHALRLLVQAGVPVDEFRRCGADLDELVRKVLDGGSNPS